MEIYFRETEERKPFITKVLGIFKEEIKDKKKILIKPNIVSIENYPTTTHEETLDAILSILTISNHEVIVGDGPAFDVNKKKVINSHKLKDICEKYNIELINFHQNRQRVIKNTGHGISRLKISNIPFTCDYIISLPVLKVHSLKNIGITGALKNQFGYLSTLQRIQYHLKYKVLNKCIADINYIVKTDLFIIDAIEILLNGNEIRHGGYKAKCGIMFAGKDPIALDSYGFKLLQDLGEKKLLGKKPLDIEYIKLAHDYGLGNTKYELVKT